MIRTSAVLLLCVLLFPPTALAETHWSFRPRSHPVLPRAEDAEGRAWVRNGVDAFVLDRLRARGLRPAPEADRITLVRRLTFDLTGLPPTPQEVAEFLEDSAPEAYERLVERLLASPHYGERWAQHWLDVVRFAESDGFEYDRYRPGMWRYRDYVIAGFNQDLAYDSFVLQQLAGDQLMPQDRTMQVAAGFHRLGPVRRNAGNKDVAVSRNEVLTEMTDSVGLVFLGLTVGCARCHDHKFDDFSQEDYYRLQAFLAATHEHNPALVSADEQARWKTQDDRARKAIEVLKEKLKEAGADVREQLHLQLRQAEEALLPPLPALCTVQDLEAERTAVHVLKRGLEERKGKRVSPGFPSALSGKSSADASDGNNARVALARWLADPEHPLTTRVYVNRVWQAHFGRGLVETANDFGENGARPSHPELLDYLANEFARGGMRLKPLQRLIVCSSTYRQSSLLTDAGGNGQTLDPDNRLLWRFPRRRLSAEEVRDAMLSAAGRLNVKAGGESVAVPVEKDLVDLLYDPSQWKVTTDVREHDRRSIYLVAKRNLRLPFGQAFDQPDLQTSCPRREVSTHALQALELLNGRTANRLAGALAARLRREAGPDHGRQVELAYRLTAGRPPTSAERELALRFLEEQPLREFALALFNVNAFLYVD